MFTKPINQYTFMGPAEGVCAACGIATGTNCIIHTSDSKVIMCDFCIESYREAIPDIYNAFSRAINKVQVERFKELKALGDQSAKEAEYQHLIIKTKELIGEINKVMQGRPTNNIEYKLNQIVKSGGIVGGNFKVASNKVKKQKQMVQFIISLMTKHGGFSL